MIEIDGSIGGGSVLRIAVPLAIANNTRMKISNIRKSRKSPGLKTQHLKGIQLLAEMTGTKLEGAQMRSQEVIIDPGHEIPKPSTIHIETAGSIGLVFQLLSNYNILSGQAIQVDFKGGGTHTRWSPNIDYLNNVTIPALEEFGQKSSINVEQHGYYPKGGASGTIKMEKIKKKSTIKLDLVEEHELFATSRASKTLQQAKVAERQLRGLEKNGIDLAEGSVFYDNTSSTGTSLTVWQTEQGKIYRGYSYLGEKGVPAEKIGENVAKQIHDFNSRAAVDEFLADQLMLALSQSENGSYYTIPRLTQHVTTNLDLINSLTNDSLTLQHHDSYYILSKI